MARTRTRKRLNKRVVIILGVVLGLIGAAVAVTVILKMPKDPQPFIDRGDQAFQDGDYQTAARQYDLAISNGADSAELFLQDARAHFEVVSIAELSEVMRRRHFATGRARVDQALRADPSFLEAQQLRTDLVWGDVVGMTMQNMQPDLQGFIDEATRLIAIDPDNAICYFRRGQSYRRLMIRFEEETYLELALADFQQAVELEPGNVTFLVDGQIALLEQLGRHEEAVAAYVGAIDENRLNPYLRVRYAVLLYRSDQKPEALEQIQMAIEVAQGQSPQEQIVGQLGLADYLRWEGRIEESLAAYVAAEQIDPTDFRAYGVHTYVLKQLRRFEEAIEVTRQAVQIAEEMLTAEDESDLAPEERARLERGLIDLRYRLADSLMDQVDTDRAMDEETRATYLQETRDQLSIIDVQQDIVSLQPRYYKILGRIAMLDNDLAEAERHLSQAFEDTKAQGGFDEHISRLLMEVYQRMGELGRAEAMIDEYLRQPRLQNNPDVMLAKARVLMRYRDYDQAEIVINSILSERPDHAGAQDLFLRLLIETDRRRPDQLPEEVELTPQQVNVMIMQAARIWVSGERGEAIRQMEALYERAPENLNIVRRLAQMYLIVARPTDAESLLSKVIEVYPDNDELQFDLELLRETSPARRNQMRLERAEQIEDPLRRALAMATIMSLSSEEDGPQQTIAYLREAAEIDPKAGNCLERMFRLCLQLEDWEQGQWVVDLASQENLDGFGGRFYAARLAAAQDEIDAAIETLRAILRDRPQAKQVRMLLGKCHASQGDYDQAAAIFMGVYDTDHSYAPAAIQMMKVMIVQGKMYEAETWIHRAYRLAPYDPVVRNQYRRLQEVADSGADINDLIANRLQMARVNPMDLQNRFWLARLYERAERLEDAERTYLSISADSPDRFMGATVLLDFYDRTNQTGSVDTVILGLLDEASDPVNEALVYVLWGRFLGSRSLEQGLSAFNKAIELAPDDVRPYNAKAALLARYAQWGEAADVMAQCVEVIRNDPDHDESMVLAYIRVMVRYRIENNELDFADQAVTELLRDHPDDIEVLTLSGILAARHGDNERALDIFTGVIQTDGEYVPARVERAKLRSSSGEFARALEDLEAASNLAATDSQIAMQLVTVYQRVNDQVSAQLACEKILNRDPSFEPAIRKLIDIYRNQEDWTQMVSLLTDAKRRFPGAPFYYMVESDMWRQRGNVTKSLAALEAAARIAPNSRVVVQKYLLTLMFHQRYEEALGVIETYIDHESFGSWIMAVKARIYAVRGDQDRAEALFAQAVTEATFDSMDDVGSEAVITYGLNEAIEKLTGWIDLRPGDWQIRALVGGMCRQAGRLEDSQRLLNEAAQATDEPLYLANVYTSLGQTYYLMEDYEQTEQAYLRAIEISSEMDAINIAAMNNLAYMYADNLGLLDKAEEYARRAAEIAPDDPNVQDTYGWTLARLERYDEAIRYLNRSINLLRQPVSLLHLGSVYEDMGRVAQARRQYNEVAAMVRDYPDHPYYQQAQEGLLRLNEMAPEE